MSLSKKIFIIVLSIFLVSTLTIQIINYVLSTSNSNKMISIFSESLNKMSVELEQDTVNLSRQFARNLLEEIKIAFGNSLQPGESSKFLYLSNEQKKIEGLKEFSFYGINGKLEFSSNPDTSRKKVPEDIWNEGEKTRHLVMRETDDSLNFYDPLFADRDMVRLQHGWEVGKYYGMLYVEFSKDKIKQAVKTQHHRMDTLVGEAQSNNKNAIDGNLKISIVFTLIFLFIITAVLWFVTEKDIKRPITRIAEVLETSAEKVSFSSGQIASAGNMLAEGSSSQAASIEETSSSLEKMSSMTKQNADNAEQADNLMKEANNVVAQANDSMKNLTASMEEISEASEETSKIIKTIDEIAFQTNLLALNAAVEAARAGEAGAGFAVVADEVRNLAMRAADAAKNTAELIEGTVKKVKDGGDLVATTNDAFIQVAESSAKVGEIVAEIAAASNEQAQGIGSVNSTVIEMDKVVQQNAATAEKSASAAEMMNDQAAQMTKFVQNLIALVGSGAKTQAKIASTRATAPKAVPDKALAAPAKKEVAVYDSREVIPQQVIPMDDDFSDF